MIFLKSKNKRDCVSIPVKPYEYIWVDTHKFKFKVKDEDIPISYSVKSDVSYMDNRICDVYQLKDALDFDIEIINSDSQLGPYKIKTVVYQDPNTKRNKLSINMVNWKTINPHDNALLYLNKYYIYDIPLEYKKNGKIAIYTDIIAVQYINDKSYTLNVSVFYNQVENHRSLYTPTRAREDDD